MEINASFLVGMMMCLFGIYSLFARQMTPAHFSKLEPMKARWGDMGGYALHFISYTLLPIAVGITMLLVRQ